MTPPTLTPSPPVKKRRRGLVLLSAVLAAGLGITVASVTTNANAADTLLSQGKTATASTVENDTVSAANAVDGNAVTRWSSQFADPQWIRVDLGATATISQVVLQWEGRGRSGSRTKFRPRPTATPGPRSTPRRTAPVAPRR